MSDSLNKSSLMSLYPSVLDKDTLFNALGQSAAEAIGAAFIASKNASIYTRIAELDEGVLDILAKDFNIVWYDYDFQLETKRRVIAAAFSVLRHFGTKGAMVTAISAIWPNSTVEEWFEYDGDPYYFRAIVEASENDSEQIRFSKIEETILLYKNERSWLEGNNVILKITFGIVINTNKSSEDVSIYHVPAAGTVPRWSTHGSKGTGGLEVGGVSVSSSYSVRKCGTSNNALF